MRLFIAEKPELGRAIARHLGGGTSRKGYIDCGEDVVTWCFGHLLELCEPADYDEANSRWEIEKLPLLYAEPKYKVAPGKESQLKNIERLLKKCTSVVHAGDPDEEGQLLVEEVLRYFHCKKPVMRLLINDMNERVVKKALGSMKDNREYLGLYYSAYVRSICDQAFGFNLTRGFTLANQLLGKQGVFSVGRVQTPVLSLIVQRDKRHEAHIKEKYYEISASFLFDEIEIEGKYKNIARPDKPHRLTCKSEATRIANECEGEKANLEQAETEEKKQAPLLPYNLLELQADCSRKFGIKPDAVLCVTQELREKYKIITYNRSDCRYLSDEQHEDAPAILESLAKNTRVLRKAAIGADPSIKGRCFNSNNVSAHHAIVPTDKLCSIDSLPEEHRIIYLLIARAYIAQFYPLEEYTVKKVEVRCGPHLFTNSYRVTHKQGWRVLYKNDKGNEDAMGGQDIAERCIAGIERELVGKCLTANIDDKETVPPKRYTASSLLKDMANVAKYVKDAKIRALLIDKDSGKKGENGGLGTPATRSEIVSTLIRRGFVKEDKKKLISTPKGRDFIASLPDSVTMPDITALWHERQVRVRLGEEDPQSFIDSVFEYIAGQIESIQRKASSVEVVARRCKECGEVLKCIRKGKSKFWGCSGYPTCKQTYSDKKGEPDYEAVQSIEQGSKGHKCRTCGGYLVPRKSKHGKFWGCQNYPKCRQTYNNDNEMPMFDARKEA